MLRNDIPALPPARAWARARRLQAGLVLAGTPLLTACATVPSYQPYTGTDAARLRVRLLIPADYRPFLLGYDFRSTVGLQSVQGTACSPPTWTPQLRLFRGVSAPPTTGPQAVPGAPPPEPVKYPRAGMRGTTEPENTESVELTMAPGLHVVNLNWTRARGNSTSILGALLTKNCPATNVALQLEPGSQYELVAGFKDSECAWEARKLQGQAFVPTKVLKEGGPAEVCAGNLFRR